MKNPLQNIMSAMAPLLPDREAIRNPVSEFLDNLITERVGDAPEAELLRTVVVNNSNDDPNGVIDMLVEIHDKIGDFVTKMNDGNFDEWQPPVEPELVSIGSVDIGAAEAVLELP